MRAVLIPEPMDAFTCDLLTISDLLAISDVPTFWRLTLIANLQKSTAPVG